MPPAAPILARLTTRSGSDPEPLRRRRTTPPPSSGRARKVLNSLLLFVTVVLVVDALVGEKGFMDTLRARKQYAELAASVQRLRSENAGLRDMARRLREDPATIESIAREELGLVRPGEVLVIVKDRQ